MRPNKALLSFGVYVLKLNLAFIFDDAVRALAGHANRLAVAPLPATVYLMQGDVINHYRHALDHGGKDTVVKVETAYDDGSWFRNA